MSAHLERLVREWRDAQKAKKAIDAMTVKQRNQNREALDRLIAAHKALIKYIDEEMG